jgi:hypothetical protein
MIRHLIRRKGHPTKTTTKKIQPQTYDGAVDAFADGEIAGCHRPEMFAVGCGESFEAPRGRGRCHADLPVRQSQLVGFVPEPRRHGLQRRRHRRPVRV